MCQLSEASESLNVLTSLRSVQSCIAISLLYNYSKTAKKNLIQNSFLGKDNYIQTQQFDLF